MRITIIGHNTVLVETANKKILTDPYFETRGNPAYGRITPPAKPREAFHDVDLVLVSHNHWDHIDRQLLQALPANVPILTPNTVKWMTALKGARHPVGLQAWESKTFDSIEITAVPAQHFTVACGFVIESEGKQVYFAGDTFYGAFMAKIGKRFKLDAALMPVTTFVIPMTMGEKQAVHAVQDMKPGIVIPIHLDVQPRSPLMRTQHTPEGFIQRLRDDGLETEVVLLKNGESYEIEDKG